MCSAEFFDSFNRLVGGVMQLQVREKPVVLTGYDIIVNCPTCKQQQVVSDDIGGVLRTDEHVSLHAARSLPPQLPFQMLELRPL